MCDHINNTIPSEFNEQLKDDTPITSLAEDKFGREQFIQNLATALIPQQEMKSKSKVLALIGSWGVGKTSVINIVCERLTRTSENLHIIHFNPWQYIKKDDLIKPFLEEIFLGCSKEKIKLFCLRRKISKYYKNFDFSSVKGYLLDLIAALGTLIAFFFSLKQNPETVNAICIPVISLSNFINNVIGIQTILYLIPTIIFALLFIFSLVRLIHTWLNNDIKSKKISQADQKEDISKYIRKKEIHFLIIIDDIDRLTPEEILQVFRIIRTNADFANTTYLLSFDKSAVINNLNSIKIDGKGFIEKIITMEYGLSEPPAFYRRRYIDEFLREILNQKNTEPLLDWQNEAYKYNQSIRLLAEAFTTMRDIKRFNNSFFLHINILINDGVGEVNFIDLALLECIFLKYRDCYYGIQNNKLILTKTKEEHTAENITNKTIKTTIKEFAKTEIELKLVLWLFPTVYYAFKDLFSFSISDYEPEYTYHSNICSPNYFDIYFSTGINIDDPEHISNKEISEFIGVSFNKAKMVELLKKFLSVGKFSLFIDILQDICRFKSFISDNNAASFVAAMFDTQCIVPYEQKKFFETNMRDSCKQVISTYLKRFYQDTKAIILQAIEESQYVYSVAAFFFGQEQLTKTGSTDALFRESDIEDIKKAVLDKLRTYKQERGTLFWEDDDLEEILGYWYSFDSDSFNNEMASAVATDEKLCNLMINLYKRRLGRDSQYFPYHTMAYFGNMESFKQRLQEAIHNNSLNERELIIANYFISNFQYRNEPYIIQQPDNALKLFDNERENLSCIYATL